MKIKWYQDHPEKAKLLKPIARQQVAQTHMVQHHRVYKFVTSYWCELYDIEILQQKT